MLQLMLLRMPPLLGGVQTSISNMIANMAAHPKVENEFSSRSTYTTPGHIPKRFSVLPQRHLPNHVYYGVFHDSQKLERA